MLIISRHSWATDDIGALKTHVEDAVALLRRRQFDASVTPLVLLPQAGVSGELMADQDALAKLGELAVATGAQIAGAATMKTSTGLQIVGFLIDADGKEMIAAPKISPDLVTGINPSSTCGLGEPASFPTAMTSIGQVGILPGEDVLFPHYARALTWSGAEIILNPVSEVSDQLSPARHNARRARAWENTSYVAVAGASEVATGGPSCAALIDWNGAATLPDGEGNLLLPDVDIERLRRRRNAIFAVQPLHLRAHLYADGYQRLIKGRNTAPKKPANEKGWRQEIERRREEAGSTSDKQRVDQYDVILTQTVGKIIQRDDDVVALRRENTQHAMTLAGRMASSPTIKLVVVGEFFMHGQGGHGYRSPITLERLAIRYPGPEMELLQDFALKHKVYVAGSTFEIDDKFPGHIFNSAFILNDTGELIHRFRKIQCADVWGSLPDTTPGSIYDRYLDTYGYDFLFPIADTPIGRLGTMVCFDQAHPEIARMLTKYGAEVIIHPSSEGHGCGRAGWDAARASRAFENTAYVLSAMPGGEYFNPSSGDLPTTQLRGHSKIISFDGSVQGVADGPGACILTGTVDLKALQRARANVMTNLPLWDDPEVYAHVYSGEVGLPNNLWGPDPLVNPYIGFTPLKERLESFYQRGIFIRPSGSDPNAPVMSSGVYGPTRKPASSTRLADQDRLEGESIQV